MTHNSPTVTTKAYRLFKRLSNKQLKDFLMGYATKLPNDVYVHKTAGCTHTVVFKITDNSSFELISVDNILADSLNSFSIELADSLVLRMEMDLSQLLDSGWRY